MPDLLVGAMICAVALGLGFLAGSAYRASELRKTGEALEELRVKNRDLSRWLQEYKEIHARDSEIATLIPSMVRRLAERHPQGALPRLAVRLTKELFKTAQVAFAVAKKDGSLLVTEGVGIPPAWKGTLTLSPRDGMIGDAMREKLLVLREEHVARRGRPELSDLERAGMVPDAVIPIVVENSVVAILAVAGSAGRMDRDRPYASMLADLVANAFQISLAIDTLEQRAMTDPLTGLYNRAYLADRFLVELRRARNYGFPMSVALFDIDRFKRINDRHGHPAGDAVLRKLASFLRERTRSTDAVVRYGGEEFAVLMATADSDVAFQQADRIRAELEKTPFVVPGQAEPVQVTISGGVATYPQDGQTFSELIAVADAGLYHAKENGRNRVSGSRPVELRP
ncbi:MAG: sensor domain-containing diguanylate cyclase [Candidatus Deferrimicrobiota bacterium]